MAEPTFTPKERNALLVAATMLATTLLHLGPLAGGFMHFDDPENIYDNYSIREFSLANVGHYFSTPLQYMYTPLVSISYAIDYQFGRLDPTAYHVTNLVLHLCNIVLVYRFCRALTPKVLIAHVVTVAFALHPANVDTVSWISTRSTLLATAFSLGMLLLYLRYLRTGRPVHLVMALVLFGFALLSKSTAVALPVSLVLLDYYRRREFSRRLVLEKVPFFAASLVAGIVALQFRIDTNSLYAYTFLDRIFLVTSALAGYLARLVLPYPLAFAYGYPAKSGAFLPWYLYLTPVVLAVVVWLLSRTSVPRRTLVFGLGFFLVNIALSQAVLLVDNYKSNRYGYLPYVGLFFVAGSLAARLVDRKRTSRPALVPVWQGVLAVFVVFFAVLTYDRADLWRDPVRVLDSSIAHEPGVPFIYNTRGMAEYKQGDYPAALADFDRAIALDPTFTLGYYYRGVIKGLSGDHRGAVVEFDRAIELSSGFAPGYSERGKAKIRLQDYTGALADLSQAIAWDAYFVDAYLHRGIAYQKLGSHSAAIADLTRVIELAPDHGEAFLNRGNARFGQGDGTGACADWRAASSLGFPQAGELLATNCRS